MTISNTELHRLAVQSTIRVRELAPTRKGWDFMGYVGAALLTDYERVYTGINLALLCGIGFCAEHSAVAEMVRHGETRIKTIVATTARGTIIPPCGRCRELLYQIDPLNLSTQVLISSDICSTLSELLPNNWQPQFDKPLA